MPGPHDLFARYTFAQVEAAPEGSEHLLVVTRYLMWVGGKAVHRATRRVLHSALGGQRAEALMRSYGEQLIERGIRRGLAKGREEGQKQGRAEDILRILSARGVHVDEDSRQRILTCTELSTLDRWFDRSLNATTLFEVLEDVAS